MLSFSVMALIALMFFVDLSITLVNYNHRNQPIPANARDIYDQEKYTQWLNYSMDTLRYEVIVKTFTTALLLALLGLGVFGRLQTWTDQWFSHPILQTLAFLFVFMLVSMLISLPFDYYATFVIEAKYGFNKSTQKTFFLDLVKNLLLMMVLGGGVVAALQALYLLFADRLWLFILSAWALLSVIMIVVFILNTKVFVKIFNKLTPLPENELKDDIQAMAGKVGFNVNAIWIMDASKRSTKLNAFFSGLGKIREVVLFDTLMEKLAPKEILSVLAHELGHAVHNDVPRLLGVQIAVFGIYAGLIGAVLQSPELAQSFGLTGPHFGFSLVLFGILMEPIQLLLGIPINYISRRAEFAADAFAARLAGKAPTTSAFKILAQENLANLNPHPLYVWIHYSHPPIPERLRAISEVPDAQ